MNENKISKLLERIHEKLEFEKKKEKVNRTGLFHDGYTFSINERKVASENMWFTEISSSLMIPENFLPLLKRKIKKHKSIGRYLRFLLSSNKLHIINGILPNYKNVNTKYQDKEQNLKKVGIRALGSDWAEMQLLRISHGVSMSAIFVFLLKIDSVDFAETVSEFLVDAGIPVLLHLDLFGEVRLKDERFNFYRIFGYRESFS